MPEIKRAAQPSEISRLCSSDLFSQADIRNPLRYVALHQITAPHLIWLKKKIMRLSGLLYEDSSVLWKASV